jgi:predicted component of type VI protein secretion system
MAFLPGGKHHNQLRTLVETYTEDQWQVALRLELRADEVPKMQLNGQCRLGANSWLLSQPAEENAQIEFRSLAA